LETRVREVTAYGHRAGAVAVPAKDAFAEAELTITTAIG
jgi:hypothetical protein